MGERAIGTAEQDERTQSQRIRRIRRKLLRWGALNRRRFPWREDRDLYRTVLTEILLKQTTATRIGPVRERLIEAYPTPAHMAQADPENLYKVIRTLGFGRQRTSELMSMANAIVHSVKRPHNRASLSRLPGIGPYGSAAVACFAFGAAECALDVNVARIIARLFGIEAKGELRRNEPVAKLGRVLVTAYRPREMNWTLLDLGALICTATPKCGSCPLRAECVTAQSMPLRAGKQCSVDRRAVGMLL